MNKIIKSPTQKIRQYNLAVVSQMVKLATNGFGLVAALAWNNVIKEFVEEYVKKYLSVGSGFISLLIYAILITTLAVTATLQLSRLEQTLKQGLKK